MLLKQIIGSLCLSMAIVILAPITGTQAQKRVYTLTDCIEIALENNLTVQRGRLDQKSAEINYKQSKMDRLPDFSVGAGYGSNWGRSIDPVSNQFSTTQINSAGLNGSTSMTLFSGFQLSNAIKQSNVSLNAVNNDLEKVKNDVALSVATLYLNVIFNQELVENSRFQLNSTSRQLARTKKLVDAGSLPVTNLLDLQAQQATNELNLVNSENNFNLAVLQLKQALLLPGSAEFEVVAPEIAVEKFDALQMDAEAVYKTAELNQPQIKSADLRIQEADISLRISKGAYAPRLTLNGGFSTNYSSAADIQRAITGDPFSVDIPGTLTDDPTQSFVIQTTQRPFIGFDSGYSLGSQFDDNISRSLNLNLSVPIFNRGRTRTDVQLSMIARRRAEISSKEVRNELRQTIETSYNDLLAASKSHGASIKQVTALQESFRVTENQYNLGAVNFVDFQVAANNLFIAKSDLVRAKYDYIFKKKVLDFYLGKPLSF